MTELNKTSLDEVLNALGQLGITFEFKGPMRPVNKVCSLLNKEPGGLYYYTGTDGKVIDALEDSVVICDRSVARATETCSCIAVEVDPQNVFYRLCGKLFDTRPERGIHPTAIIHPDAEIGPDVHVGPYTVIGRATIGAGTLIGSHTAIMDGCRIGERVEIGTHCCIGATGAVWVWGDDGDRIVLPQVGGVVIGDDAFLSADVSVVRGLLNEYTTVGRGCMIAPGSKLGHSVVLEEEVHLANNVSIAGSARIGARSFLGSGSSVRSHANIAKDTIVGLGAAVVRDVLLPGTTVAGVPAVEMPKKEQRKGVPKARRTGN